MAKKKKGRARKSSGISENDSEEPERADLVEDTRTEEAGEGEETVSAAAASEEDMEEEQEQEEGEGEEEKGEEETTEEPDRILQCRESPEGFLAALSDHHNKDLEFDLEESLASLSSEDLASLWLSLHDHLRSVGEDARLEVVSGLVTVTKLTLSLPTLQEENCPQGLISSAGLLHDILPSLADPKLCNSLAQSLETYFTINLPDKDSVILNVLIFLLRKSLGEKAAKNDVRRVWSLHTTLLQQTLTETETLTRLVAATAGSNLFLSTSEGVKWLTFLHSLSPALVLRLHQESRASLPRLSKAGCRGLGEVYHKAWLVSGGEFRARLETDCLQDLMYRGMVGRKQEANNILTVLSCLHSDRRSQPTQNMLSRLYNPILWRFLKVANHEVRQNATVLFLEAYPLEDLELTREERDFSLERQHSFIITLLRDADPSVRVAAITGVCRIFSSYWQLISSDFINQVISLLFKETVSDCSSPKVRMATIKGISEILSTPQSHVYLKAILDKLSGCIHDTNDGVRGAFLELLHTVKGMRNIKFWNIVEVKDLVARLEVEKGFIGRKICKLLINSYFPTTGDGCEVKQLERCISLIQMNRAASRRFYQLSAEFINSPDCFQFMVNILTSVRMFIKKIAPGLDDTEVQKENSKKRKRKLYSNSDSEVMSDASDTVTETSTMLENTTNTTSVEAGAEDSQEIEDHPYKDNEVVGGILDIVCILWMAKSEELSKPENDGYRNSFEKKAGKWMTQFFKHFKATAVINPVVFLSSFLPERAVAHVASYCLAKAKDDTNWKTHVDSLCHWRKGESLLELVVEGIKAGLAPEVPASQSTSRGVRFEEPISKGNQVKVGLKIMNHILDNKTNRYIVLAKNKPMLEEVLKECEALEDYVVSRLSFSRAEQLDSAELASILSIQSQLLVLLHPDNAVAKLEEQLSWAERELLPVLGNTEESPASTREQRSLARALLVSLSNQVCFYLSAGLADPDLTSRCLGWALELLYEGGIALLQVVTSMLLVAAQTASTRQSQGWKHQYEENIPVNFARLLCWLSTNLAMLEEEEEVGRQFTAGIKQFLTIYNKLQQKDPESWEDLLDVTVTSIASLMGKKVEDQEDLVKEQLGRTINSMMDIVLGLAGQKEVLRAVEELVRKLTEEDGDFVSSMRGFKMLLCFVETDGSEKLTELIDLKITEKSE